MMDQGEEVEDGGGTERVVDMRQNMRVDVPTCL